MHAQQHLDNLAWALRHLETFVQAQLGAAGEEGLAKFRQTYDHLHSDLGHASSVQEHLTEVKDQLATAQTARADAEAALVQLKNGQAALTLGEDGPLIAEAAGRISATLGALLLQMREYGTMPPELEAKVADVTGAVDTLLMLAPSGEQAPVSPPPVGSTDGNAQMSQGGTTPEDAAATSKGGKPADDANKGVENSGPGADQVKQNPDPQS